MTTNKTPAKAGTKDAAKAPTASEMRNAAIGFLVAPSEADETQSAGALELAERVTQIPARLDWTKDQRKALGNQTAPLLAGAKRIGESLSYLLFVLAFSGVTIKAPSGSDVPIRSAYSRAKRAGALAVAWAKANKRPALSEDECHLFQEFGRISGTKMQHVTESTLHAWISEQAGTRVTRGAVEEFVKSWQPTSGTTDPESTDGTDGPEEGGETATASQERADQNGSAWERADSAVVTILSVWDDLTEEEREALMTRLPHREMVVRPTD